MSKAAFFMQYVISVPILLELKYILSLWLGDTIPQHTITFVQLVLINAILNSLNMPMSQIVQASGKIRLYQLVRSSILILVLPLSYVFIKIYNLPEVVFIAMILITIAIQPISLILVHKVFKFNYKVYILKVLLPSLSFALIMPIPAIFILNLLPTGLFRLLLTGLVVVVSSILFAWMFFLSAGEKHEISSFLNRRIRRVNY
jgi:O-antigen/teichoic acid export membrane protein